MTHAIALDTMARMQALQHFPLRFEDFRYPQDTKFEYERASECW